MAITRGILEEVSRVIAEHLGKPENLITLERCLDKLLGYEHWLQIEVLNALTDAGLHPDYLEMWIDAHRPPLGGIHGKAVGAPHQKSTVSPSRDPSGSMHSFRHDALGDSGAP